MAGRRLLPDHHGGPGLLLRLAAGRNAQPSAAIVDSQTLSSTPESGSRAGYDGHKRKKGAKGKHVELISVDQGSTGDVPVAAAAAHGIALHVVELPEAKHSFVLLPGRWVAERSFAGKTCFRRLVRDDERLLESFEGLHLVAFSCLMLQQAVDLLAEPEAPNRR